MNPHNRFSGETVLVTGHTGFKGSWLAWWLHRLGARVTGLALPPEHKNGPFALAGISRAIRHVEADVCDAKAVLRVVQRAKPRVVFHLAAQALVRRSYRDPLDTFETNVLGTANVLEAVRQLDRPCAVVVVTSDKCYENPEDLHPHREADPMGGADPYSASKGCAELVAAAYRRSFFSERSSKILVASARAGNVIGPGDWAEDRLVPDAVRALQAGRSILVRRPAAIRPWQHVLEPLSGYLRLATVLLAPGGQRFAEAWNFGPEPASALSVAELVDLLVREWGRGSWHAGDGTGPSEARYLRLSIRKAAARLAWRPAWTVKQAVRETVEGYRAFGLCRGDAEQARRVMDEAIARYTASARRK